MVKYPYTQNTGSLKKFLRQIPMLGKPEKVTQRYLVSIGFKSKNDRRIIPTLKFLKFIDNAGTPTEKYVQYRDKSKSKIVLGAAIQEGYIALFRQYPDADQKDNATLQNYFSTYTGLAEKSVKTMVDTFKALCTISDLQGGSEISGDAESEEGLGYVENDRTSFHNLSLSLSTGKKAKIIVPEDISEKDIEKLKSLLDVLK